MSREPRVSLLRPVNYECGLISAVHLLVSTIVNSLLLKSGHVYMAVRNRRWIELGEHAEPIRGNTRILAAPKLPLRDIGGIEGAENAEDYIMVGTHRKRHGHPDDTALGVSSIR